MRNTLVFNTDDGKADISSRLHSTHHLVKVTISTRPPLQLPTALKAKCHFFNPSLPLDRDARPQYCHLSPKQHRSVVRQEIQ